MPFKDRSIELSTEDALSLASDWDALKDRYITTLDLVLNKVDHHYRKFVSRLSAYSAEFKKFLVRTDNKKAIASSFYHQINSRLASGKMFFGEQLQRFNDSIEEMVNEIWDIVDQRKEDAILYRAQLMQSNSFDKEFKGILRLAKRLLDTEYAKYIDVWNILGKMDCLLVGQNFESEDPAPLEIDEDLELELDGRYPVLDDLS